MIKSLLLLPRRALLLLRHLFHRSNHHLDKTKLTSDLRRQRMETSGIADRVALLAHDHLVEMYERMGFEGAGKSNVRFAGGGWNDLVSEMLSLSGGSES